MANAIALRQRHVRAAQAVDLRVLYTSISAGMLLVRRYLTGRGVDQEFADRYGSAFGRTAAKIYRTSNGAEPRRAWSLVSGKWRRVNGYLPTDAEVLDQAFTTYKRTAEYVAPAPTEPLMEFESAADATVVVRAAADSSAPYRWTCSAGHDGNHPYASLPFCRDDAKTHAKTCGAEQDRCRLPGCDGTWHHDGTCTVRLPEVEFDGVDVTLSTELVADNGQPPEIVAFAFNMTSFETRRAMRARASASEFTAQLRRLADAIDGAAALLPA
ncbi:hypothetical protein [Streptomyces lincolnensis]|uniref:hypothetical protein n=1 Tax=Streptomyces lincolnensis TaxID=1915 RepID=UPI0037D69232